MRRLWCQSEIEAAVLWHFEEQASLRLIDISSSLCGGGLHGIRCQLGSLSLIDVGSGVPLSA